MELHRETPSFHAVVESNSDGTLVLRVPHSKYQLHLDGKAGGHDLMPGQRLHGVIVGDSLRMHAAHGGGKFIEPVWGPPRIVAGTVIAADAATRTVIVDAVAIFRLRVPAEQKWEALVPGNLVNFYLKSGARFEPTH